MTSRTSEALDIAVDSDQGVERAKARTALAVHTDELTEALRDAEDAIDALRLGVSARVPIGPDQHLMWKKSGSDWGLHVEQADGNAHLVTTQSRKIRIVAAETLPALYAALLAEHARQDDEVVEATRKVRAFIDRLSEEAP